MRTLLGRSVLALFIVSGAYVGLRSARRAVFPLPMDRCRATRFDAAVWRDSLEAFTAAAPRGCMVDDLLASHRLVGASRSDVVALLGPPARSPASDDRVLEYWLGPERSFISIDSELLVLRTGPDGRVVEQLLRTD